ncbi:Urease accessory protein UreD 1 [Methylocella tundrae]|uniref:Urease accessory protein UreD n=1 Tax=Methylocella tundrae TaxID=227605 RepID=A0A8B6M1N0_METTU|nr:urease accessory protein UreD [Methylocella tundrae]VTZ20929.1 Urease accessory protein UreD 1 [Methylocella tundrae]VTZ48654.1 Urease accessory protein UreD 1 [Methylocella tundrae]
MPGNALAIESGRRSHASLVFAKGGGRTFLNSQRVPYPFHITRPFWLDAACPDLATLYLQSASGGVYRGDHLRLSVEAKAGARAHVTTQSSSVVHDTGASPARQDTSVVVAPGAFLALTPDPLILFPGAALTSAHTITINATSCAIVTEGFACHDPSAAGRAFQDLELLLTILRDGEVIVRERSRVAGEDVFSKTSPLGPYRAYASMIILAPREAWPDALELQRAFDAQGCLAGASALQDGAGLCLRCLAPDGGALRDGLKVGFDVAFAALAGATPARRRK